MSTGTTLPPPTIDLPAWIPDDQLEDDQRGVMCEYTTPRILDRVRLWPVAELGDADG
jgi:hypothetical protein